MIYLKNIYTYTFIRNIRTFEHFAILLFFLYFVFETKVCRIFNQVYFLTVEGTHVQVIKNAGTLMRVINVDALTASMGNFVKAMHGIYLSILYKQ